MRLFAPLMLRPLVEVVASLSAVVPAVLKSRLRLAPPERVSPPRVRVVAAVPPEALQRAFASGEIAVRLEVDAAHPGGLAVYGERFGRYPLDPTLLFVLRDGPGVSR